MAIKKVMVVLVQDAATLLKGDSLEMFLLTNDNVLMKILWSMDIN